ncbi:hypothetical protein AAEP80_04725 [Curtobacterium sp. L3-7]|uniref:hypothetical protein n=1 Tax=Curtobacterium sp. L3-7 TaxID=3138787 RepID=UPI003B529330
MSAVTATTRPAAATAAGMPLDALLGGLERAVARLPHAVALPVMVAHAALSTVAYR